MTTGRPYRENGQRKYGYRQDKGIFREQRQFWSDAQISDNAVEVACTKIASNSEMMTYNREKNRSVVYIALMTAITVIFHCQDTFLFRTFHIADACGDACRVCLESGGNSVTSFIYAIGLVGLLFSLQGGFRLHIQLLSAISFSCPYWQYWSFLYRPLKVFGLILPSILLLLFGAMYYLIFINNDMTIGSVLISFMLIFIPAEIIKSLAAYYLGVKLKPLLYREWNRFYKWA